MIRFVFEKNVTGRMRIHNLVKLLYENSAQKLLFKAKLKVKKKG
jgi:hypothetical protein